MSNEDMYVIKRDGSKEEIAFDKILKRVKKLGTEAELSINYTSLVMKIIEQLYDGIETSKIDELTAQHCASQITTHPDFGVLASYIVISNLHKNTTPSFATTMELLYEFFDNKKNKKKPFFLKSFY